MGRRRRALMMAYTMQHEEAGVVCEQASSSRWVTSPPLAVLPTFTVFVFSPL